MPTYPNEIFPDDETIAGLNGTADTLTGLPYIAKGVNPTSTPSYEVQYNRRLQRQNMILASWRQGMVVDEGNLKIGVYPVDYTLAGERKSFAGATNQSLPDEVTRFVYLDQANVLQIQPSWPADIDTFLPLAEVSTVAGTISIKDVRTQTAFRVDGSGPLMTAAVTSGTVRQINLRVAAGGLSLVRAWLADGASAALTATPPDNGFTAIAGRLVAVLNPDVHLLLLTEDGRVELAVDHRGAAQSWILHAESGGRVAAMPIEFL